MRSLAVVMAIVLCGLAFAKSDDWEARPPTDPKYVAALDKGRELQNKKKYAEAIAAFEEALKIVPDDATVLGEIGWTAYLQKDLKKAEEFTRRSLANIGTHHIRGATLYNLGLIQEANGDRAGAIASYTASLKERWNATVRAALVKLDPGAAAALDPYKPHGMDGPYTSIDDFCKKKKPPEMDLECTCAKTDAASLPAATKPYDAIDIAKQQCNRRGGKDYLLDDYWIATKVGGAWYFDDVELLRRQNMGCKNTLDKLEVKVDGTRLLLWVEDSGKCWGLSGTDAMDGNRRALVVVGVGPSGKPSATPSLLVEDHMRMWPMKLGTSPDDSKKKVYNDVSLELTWGKDGALEVKGKTKSGDPNLLGKHTFAFP